MHDRSIDITSSDGFCRCSLVYLKYHSNVSYCFSLSASLAFRFTLPIPWQCFATAYVEGLLIAKFQSISAHMYNSTVFLYCNSSPLFRQCTNGSYDFISLPLRLLFSNWYFIFYFCWRNPCLRGKWIMCEIPSHVILSDLCINGNTVVEQETKDAWHDPISTSSIPYKPLIRKYILKRWQQI